MKLAIMQPYFLPYIGYFQLISAADIFVVYDNIKFTKKGWINRNRLLVNGSDALFSLPLKKDSDFLNVDERSLSENFDRDKMLNQFKGAYLRAPYFAQIYPLLEGIICNERNNLFRFILRSITDVCSRLGISTEIRISSEIDIHHELKSEDKVLALCDAVGASTYLNAIGGMDLYSREVFEARNIELKFIKTRTHEYIQFGAPFVPNLSIIDVMMFNDKAQCAKLLEEYELV